MDTSTLAAAVVQMISAVIGGTTQTSSDPTLGAVAQRAYSAIRTWASTSELGRAALSRFEEQPDEPARKEVLRSVLEDAIASNPELAHQLRETTAGYVAAQESSIGGNQENFNVNTIRDVRGRNQISIGPMTITNTKPVRRSLTAVAIVALLLVAFGIYGLVRIFSEPSGSGQQGRQIDGGGSFSPSTNEPVSGLLYKTTQHQVDLIENTDESHLQISVQFGAVGTDYSICNFSSTPGTVVIPFTVSVSNVIPSTAGYATPLGSIASLNGAAVYIVSSPLGPGSSLRTCNQATEPFMSPYLNQPGPQQREDFFFELAGVPKDALRSSGVALFFNLGNSGDYQWDDQPGSAKSSFLATVQ